MCVLLHVRSGTMRTDRFDSGFRPQPPTASRSVPASSGLHGFLVPAVCFRDKLVHRPSRFVSLSCPTDL